MWYYNGQEFDESLVDGHYGFIYLITNTENGRRYIGRKFFTKAHSRTVKGKRKKSRVPSDWMDYWGSSEELLADIESMGKDKFRREIIRLCQTLGECKYQEMVAQVDNRVLESTLPDGTPAWYNANIMMKFTRRNIGKGILCG
jgi:hypothetical protein